MGFKANVEFIEPFISGTIEAMSVQCRLEAVPGKLYLKSKDVENQLSIEIAGVIGITSHAFTGNIALCFPEKTFLGVINRMLGERYVRISTEIEDGAGELTNMVFGSAKTALNLRGYAMQKALPTVFRGEKLKVRHPSAAPVMVLPFTTGAGPFQIEIAIQSDSAAAKRRA